MTLKQNHNELSMTAEVRYKKAILGLISRLRELKPLPEHLDYMVSVKNRLSPTPQILMSIIPRKPDARTEDIIVCVEATLPVQMDIPDGIRWLEDQVTDKGLDLREMLQPEDMAAPTPPNE